MSGRVRAAAAETLVTTVSIALTVGAAWLLAPATGSVFLGGILALTLSRSQLERDRRGRIEAGIALPVIGVAAAGVGWLLLTIPVIGATVYTLGLAASVWVRRFGPVWRRLGGLLALPFIALLVAPSAVATSGPLASVAWLVPILVPLIAFAVVTLAQLGARAARLLPPLPPSAPPRAAADARGRRLPASDRMTIQLAVSLAMAFVIGFLAFPAHWAWTVLTVVVVLFSTSGRIDALVKGVSRLGGAAIGSVIASLVLAVEDDGARLLPIGWRIGIAAIALVLGIFGRRFAYAWWALCFTVTLGLVQSLGVSADGAAGGFLLGERLLEILIGAAIAVLTAWFLLPVPTTKVIRRRAAELRDAASPREDGTRDTAAIQAARARLRAAAGPFVLLQRVHLLPPAQRELIDRVRAILDR